MIFLRTSQSVSPTFDEAVYASQVARGVPPTMFTAPRAWGMPLLLAPVATFTSSMEVIRTYLALLAGLFLYLGFLPWLKIFGARSRYAYVPALAAACFVSLWISLVFGAMAYPNLWVAFLVLSGIGWFLRAVTEPSASWTMLVGLTISFGAAALIRPTEALAAAGPLLLATVLVRAWRRITPPVALVLGLGIGWVPWIVEAYMRFGGPLQRLRAGAHNSKAGFLFTLPEYLDALDGPHWACNPSKLCKGVEPVTALWWFALPLLVGCGLVAVARRRGWLAAGITALGSAIALAIPYVFLVGIPQPRFLLPTYAILFIPAAAGILWLVDWQRRWLRIAAAIVVSGALVAHVVVQQRVFDDVYGLLFRTLDSGSAQATFLKERVGLKPPCLFWGEGAIAGSYLVKCKSRWVKNRAPEANDKYIARAQKRGEMIVVKLRGNTQVPPFMKHWRRFDRGVWVLFTPPADDP
jgi:hypothetical protein